MLNSSVGSSALIMLALNASSLFAETTGGILIKPVPPDFGETSASEVEKVETKSFCAKTNEEDAEAKCDKWLEKQKKTLGDRVLTATCSDGAMADTDCLYKSVGEIKYLINKKK